MPEIKIEGITKTFGQKKILDNVTFEVKSGTITSIVGPAGAGKSTLLKTIAGIEKPDSGKIIIDGKDVTNLPPKDRNVSMVFQTYALYPHMTVYENIAFPLKVKKVPVAEIDKRLKEIAEMLNITHILNRRIFEISGGEAQRTALARALIKGSEIILLDEPLTNLDYKIREKMRGELKKIAGQSKEAVWIYATPDAREALAISSHVVVLHEGKVRQCGQIDDIYQHPKNLVVASYFSYPRLNTFECDFMRIGNESYIRELTGLFRLKIDVEQNIEHLKDKNYIVGIRPTDVKLSKENKVCSPYLVRLNLLN